MADTTIDRLQIEIEASAQSAGSGIDKLAASLQKLRDITSSSTGQLTGIQKSLQNLKNTISGMGQDAEGISRLANSMMRLNKVNLDGINGKLGTISKELGNLSITSEIPESMSMLNKGMSKLVNSFNKLDKISLEGNTEKIKRMAEALKPLTDEMLRAGPAAASYGSAIRDLSQALRTANNAGVLTQKLSNSTERLNSSFGKGFKFAGFAVWLRLLKQGAVIIARFIKNTTSYIEDMNLFSVALKDASKEAEVFTQRMEDSLGIDAGEARRNMGLFQNLVTSFGVAGDQAYILSKNLTQLGYDISSFYNISSEDAFQKLQSGIAGEIEPLRRLGVDLSQARLQQELFNLGINQSVNNLTQADKSLLRYIAIIKQTGDAQTDFARTLNTPANQLRILQAQLSLAARAIGSVFIPALNAILPPVIAVVKIFRELISTLASLVGFEMPTIEFTQPGSDLGGISGGLEDVAGAAKDAKKEINYLIGGFDELNVLNKQNEVSGNVPGGGVGNSNILDQIKLPEYDMFEGLALSKVDAFVEKLKNALDKIKSFLRPFTPLLKGIATAFTTAFALKWISKAISKIKSLSKAGSGLSIISSMVKLASNAFKEGKTPLEKFSLAGKSLWTNFKGFMSGLNPFTKVAVSLVGLSAEFVTTYEAMKNFTMGSSSLGQALANIIPITSLVGAAMYAMIGPWGLAATAGTSLIAAILGISKAQTELDRIANESFFFNNGGIKISELAAQYTKLYDSIRVSSDAIIQNGSQIDLSKDSISKISVELDNLINGVGNGVYTVEESLPKISKAFSELEKNTSFVLDSIYNNITYALAGSVGETLTELGYYLPEVESMLSGIIGDAKIQLKQLTEQADILQQQLNKGQGDKTQLSIQLAEIKKQIYLLTSESMPEITNFNTAISDINLKKLDFENADVAVRSLQDISNSALDAKNAIGDANNELIRELESIKKITTDKSAMSYIDGLIDAIRKDTIEKQSEIDSQMINVANQIQNSLNEAIIEASNNSNVSLSELLLSSWSGAEVKDLIIERVAKEKEPISKGIEENFREFGYSATNGFESGLKNSTADIPRTMEGFANDVVLSFHNSALEFGSPSKKMKQYGIWTIDGYNQGIEESIKDIPNVFSSLIDNIEISIDEMVSKVGLEAGKKFTNQFSQSLQDGWKTIISFFNLLIENWLTGDISMYFSKPVWLNIFQNVTLAAHEKTNETLNWWKLEINKWWEGYVVPMFQKSKWIGVLGGVTEAFKEINQGILSDFRKTSDELLGYLKSVINDMQEYADRHPIIIEVKTVGRELSGYSLDDSDFYATKSIHEFAGGGVVKSPTVGLMGEYAGARTNPEIVAPQSIIRDTMEEANADVIDVLYQILAAAQEIAQKDTTIELNGEQVARSVNKTNRSRGYDLGISW